MTGADPEARADLPADTVEESNGEGELIFPVVYSQLGDLFKS